MASVRRPNNLPRLSMQEIPPESTVKNLLQYLTYTETEITILQVFVNKHRVHHNHRLSHNDLLFITIPIGGG